MGGRSETETPLRKWLSHCFLDPHSCPLPSVLRGLLSPCLVKGNQGIDRFLAGLVPQPVLAELGFRWSLACRASSLSPLCLRDGCRPPVVSWKPGLAAAARGGAEPQV